MKLPLQFVNGGMSDICLHVRTTNMHALDSLIVRKSQQVSLFVG